VLEGAEAGLMVVLTFTAEREMTALATRALAGTALAGDHVFFEYESTNGMPDIVCASFDEQVTRERATGPLARPFVEAADAALLLALSNLRARHLEDIAAEARLSESYARKRLRGLEQAGAAERSQSMWIGVAPLKGRLSFAAAVELKLGHWRKAMIQAARYKAFADRSLVIVDEAHGRVPLENIRAFHLNAVGLATLSAWGRLEFALKAPRCRPTRLDRVIAGERLWHELQRDSAAVAADPPLARYRVPDPQVTCRVGRKNRLVLHG